MLDGTRGFEFSREALTTRIDAVARLLGFEPRFDGDDIHLLRDGRPHFEHLDDGFAVNAYCALEMLR
ncbi:hypothetical protein [Burkholderia pyrrocinia]|uniref:hypothetical protein n=1 Tax=Burkholderia pyrrocinia TaxID=60550 RepID=UPI002AB2EB2B|nr:hypothetical protein [Burkholderia pyrrocinia]